MFKDKDFEELDDHIENVKEETVDAAATGVSTVSAPVSTAGMKEQKAKEKGVVITDVEDSSRIVKPVRSITTLQPLLTIDPKDKGNGMLVEEEPVKIKMRDQGDLQERQRQEDDTNVALAKEFDEIQARIDADHELALMDTEAIKDIEKHVDSSSKLAGGSRKKTLAKKRAGEKKSKESTKKQKLKDVAKEQESAKSDEEAAADYEHEKKELRMWLIVVSDEEEIVDPMILSAKYPIVDWESQNLGSVYMEIYMFIR
ncbi:ribonuclease H-like domain-containing protein [Tanacetum coccineum]